MENIRIFILAGNHNNKKCQFTMSIIQSALIKRHKKKPKMKLILIDYPEGLVLFLNH